MSKIAQNYPALRIAIYGLIAAALAAAGLFGYVTEDQTAQILSVVTSLLGTLGLVLAAMNVKTGPPVVELKPVEVSVQPAPAVNIEDLSARISQRWDQGVQAAQQALAHTARTDSVADLRRRAEEQLGHRF
ncbi:hypothetical protein CH267_02180 [Rhodococcus sp. 06-621-2]|nr:hypothetical protein [Rhodococcus sp. 06-621-2]OZC62367.1 hypothetical protein CH267_02180 [Rhodococcus sp. 06-621-2]